MIGFIICGSSFRRYAGFCSIYHRNDLRRDWYGQSKGFRFILKTTKQ